MAESLGGDARHQDEIFRRGGGKRSQAGESQALAREHLRTGTAVGESIGAAEERVGQHLDGTCKIEDMHFGQNEHHHPPRTGHGKEAGFFETRFHTADCTQARPRASKPRWTETGRIGPTPTSVWIRPEATDHGPAPPRGVAL